MIRSTKIWLGASLVAGVLGACSATEGDVVESDPGAVPRTVVLDDFASSVASRRWARALQRDLRVPAAPERQARWDRHPSAVGSVPVMAPGTIARLEATSAGHLRAVVQGADGKDLAAEVELPRRSADGFRVTHRDSGMTLTVGHEPARADVAAALELVDGIAVYRDAVRGGHWLHRVNLGGTEDFVLFEEPPREPLLRYRVHLDRVAGVRFVAGVVEFLDEAGTPRLRARAPFVAAPPAGQGPWPGAGTRLETRRATLSVRGCAYDADPRAPWGRPVTAPGADYCDLEVTWDARGLGAPLVVDPTWADTTTTMTSARAWFAAVKLQNGQVLALGGRGSLDAQATAELFDPNTDTWSATGSMADAREDVAAVLLGSGAVLATGGYDGSADLQSAETYDPSTGQWSAAASMSAVRRFHSSTVLADGRVLVVGDTSDAEIYDAVGNTWTPTGTLGLPVGLHTATLLDDGRVLVVGVGTHADQTKLLNPSNGSWSDGPSLTVGRYYQTGSKLADGRVMIVGGEDEGGNLLSSTELFDPSSDTWSTGSSMVREHDMHSATPLANGGLLVAGTYDWIYDAMDYAEVYDPSGQWQTVPSMAVRRMSHTGTLLDDGRVLIAGGTRIQPLASSELFSTDAAGSSCTVGAECTSGLCVDAVCCDAACDQPCQACTAAKKETGPDGECGPVAAETDPDDDCASESEQSCGMTGTCDGLGACALHLSGTECAGDSCVDGQLTSSACDGDGTCQQTTVSCMPYACSSEYSCGTSCGSDADCADAAWCDADHACQEDLEDGSACDRGAQCVSTACVGGVCVGGAVCVEDHLLEAPDGERTDCTPYRCEGSACLQSCSSVLDCVAPHVCDAAGVCVAPSSESEDDGGCSVPGPRRAASSAPSGQACFLLLIAMGACARRRRRLPLPAR